MRLSKIICPTDFSERADAAIDYATTLGAESGATLYIVYVHEGSPIVVPGYDSYGYSTDVLGAQLERERETLKRIKPRREGVPCVHQLLLGLPAQEIIRIAEQERADLIVMGTHGRTGVRRALMGSVAEAVVRRAPCPVLTIKQPARASQPATAPPAASQGSLTGGP